MTLQSNDHGTFIVGKKNEGGKYKVRVTKTWTCTIQYNHNRHTYQYIFTKNIDDESFYTQIGKNTHDKDQQNTWYDAFIIN